MVIIVLVALNRSHMEKGLLPEHLQSLPTPNITITVDTDTTVTTGESGLRTRSEALAIDLDEQSLGCGDSVVNGSTRVSEECKAVSMA